MKIAIIGSGVSGLVTAYLLAPHHEVTLFEKDSRIGGHAHTIHIKEKGEDIAVDNGFMVYNPERYPNFVGLLQQLDVASQETEMTFGVNLSNEIAYQGTFPQGIFAQKSNIWNLRFLRFLLGVIRFKRIAKKELKKEKNNNESLEEFITRNTISRDVVNWFLFPMLSAIWSIPHVEKVSEFPSFSTLIFLDNHNLLDFMQPTWRTIVGGSCMYVSKIQKYIEEKGAVIRCNSTISHISRNSSSVKIQVNGRNEVFDYVIFATHADVTKKLLSDISPDEKTALENFSYSTSTVILHKDVSYVPSQKNLVAAWNFTQVNGSAVFTYCMNILQHIPFSTPVFVTLNPTQPVNENMVYATEQCTHPVYNKKTLEGQILIGKLQGKQRTFYAGAHLGYGFHEDGAASAVAVAKYFNILPPWKKE